MIKNMANISAKNDILLTEEKGKAFPNLGFKSSFSTEQDGPYPEDDLGEEGSTSGSVTLSVEHLVYLQAVLIQDLRKRSDGQRKFGVCPISKDPNSLLGNRTSRSCGFGESPQMHPLLAASQQFSGDDPKISAIPSDNPKARERFPELRLENQLRQNLGLGRKKSVTLTR